MNKGFKSLPEYVQRKIDPEMAKQYMGGGAVMDRPLFRQAGGPAARSPEEMAAMGQQYLMQPPAAAPQGEADAMAMLQQGEAAGMAQGQQIGEMYGEATMTSLDAADDPKSLIDAIRGNAAPLEARYTELAGLVGEEDAQQTPESVLALVQPTIMMTEEGAIDSGIGELMKGLMGEAEMTEGSGMDQGVGELMAMGAGNTPPANFNQGGPVEVRKFVTGGSVISEAQRTAPEFQKLFASAMDSEARAAALQEQREMSQAQMLFDIAGTALNFAGNTQGRSIAERLANAASQTQLTDKIGQRAAGMLSAKQAQQAEDRQLRMAGLQAAVAQAQADKTFQQNLELAKAKQSPGKAIFDTLYNVNDEGNMTGQGTRYNLADPVQLTAYNRALKTGNYRDAATAAPFLSALAEEVKPQELTQVQVTAPITIDGYTYKIGEIANLTPRQKQTNARKWSAVPDKAEFVTLNNGTETKLVITNAPGSIQTLESLGKLGWSESTLAAETAAQKEIISYTKAFDKLAQNRLFENQLKLATMADQRSAAGQELQKQIAADANALRLTIQENEQLFTTGRDQTLQGYKTALQSYGATIAEQLQNLKGQQGTEIEKLRADLRDQSSKVTSELNLANQLQVAGVKNTYEINQLATENERNIELVKLRAALGDASRIDQNVFTAAQSLLDRAASKENNVLSINARAALQDSAQRFDLNENEKDRVLKASESALARVAALNLQVGSQEHSTALQEARLEVRQSEGLSEREARALEGMLNRASRETMQVQGQEFDAIQAQLERDFKGSEAEKKALATLLQNLRSNAISDRGLDLQEARDLINGAATTSRAAVDRERFELEKAEKPLLASKGTNATIRALADQTKLDAYADGTMPASEANAYDTLIKYWATSGSEKYSAAANNGQGGYIPTAGPISPALKRAIAARAALLGSENVPDLSNKSSLVTSGAPGSVAAYRFNKDGTINFDSFKEDPTLIITGVDLSKSQGVGSGFNRFFNAAGAIINDLTFGVFGGEGGKDSRRGVTRQADAELEALARKTISVARQGVEGKVFALDLNLLAEEVKNFRPGSFGQDRAALDQLYVTRASLASEFSNLVDIVNNASSFQPKQVTAAKAAYPKMEELLGEFTAAILVYERALDTFTKNQASTASDQVQGTTNSGGSLTGTAPRVK